MGKYRLEKNNINKVRSEVDSVMTTDKIGVQDATLSAMESLVIPMVDLAMKLVEAPSSEDADSFVPKSDQRIFSGSVEGVQMTASSRLNSKTELKKIVEARDNITVEGKQRKIF